MRERERERERERDRERERERGRESTIRQLFTKKDADEQKLRKMQVDPET